MPHFSLTTRAFLFSFLPVCLVLLLSFWALSAANRELIEQELRQSLLDSDALLNRVNVEHSRQTSKLLAQLTDSAGLKAAVGLLAEGRGDPSVMEQIRRTIEAQLRELHASSPYDLIAISDIHGKTVAAVASPNSQALEPLPVLRAQPGLEQIQDALYQLESVPVVIAGEPAAMLILGTRFELSNLSIAGQAVLLRDGKVVLSMLPARWNTDIEKQISAGCAKPVSSCEITLGAESFVVSQLETARLGDGYRLLGFRSLDSRLRQFNAAFFRILIEVGAAGIFLALLGTLLTSYSVSQPLRHLVAQLKKSESEGELPERLTVQNGARELDALAAAFNRVAENERESRRELESAKDAAESANRLKTEFLTNISHELRTPMNGVLNMTDLLLDTPLTADQQDFANVVRDCGQSLMSLIDGILNFSLLDSGKLKLELAPFNFHEMLAAAAADVQTRAEQKGLRFELTFSSGEPCNFIGDRERIRQVVMQIADNAVKFTEKGSVHIHYDCPRAGERDAECRVVVTDTGIGIDPTKSSFIFQKFSQVDGSLTRRYGGTGLGLAMAKELIELMGGKIGFDSRVNDGSRFWFSITLPIADPAIRLEHV
ncbi:MAG TPA: ATP-binding protein [Bryobacteraceae bacterium]|jgi:signal transduction histidine kinase